MVPREERRRVQTSLAVAPLWVRQRRNGYYTKPMGNYKDRVPQVTAPYTSPLAEELAPGLLERFDRYVRIFTTSARDGGEGTPSSPGQWDLARLLVDELRALGLADAAVDDHCYVTATLAGDGPAIGLIAHVDTSPDAPGQGVD